MGDTKKPLLCQEGEIVLIRTAVYHAIGTVGGLLDVGGVAFVRLNDAVYLGDTGRYNEATSKPIHEVDQAEMEPVGNGGVLDVQVAIICDVAKAKPFDKKVK